jgi:hypothetical protein
VTPRPGNDARRKDETSLNDTPDIQKAQETFDRLAAAYREAAAAFRADRMGEVAAELEAEIAELEKQHAAIVRRLSN